MNRRRAVIAMVLMAVLVLQIGCTSQVPDGGKETGGKAQQDVQRGIMEEFDRLAGDGAKLAETVEFINDNIAQMSGENASVLVNRLEEMQRENLSDLGERFYSDAEIQNALNSLYQPGAAIDMEDADRVEHEGLRALLMEAGSTGYRVETAEGMYFPIIDYSFHQKYSDYVSDDMKEYIEIMAVESGEVPAKDAALVIGWDEIVERALRQDRFLENYPDSIKMDDIRQLHKNYIMFSLYGLNNTPLFGYDNQAMDGGAKDVFMQAVEGGEDGEYIKILKTFLEMLEKNNYRLTDEADEYRKAIYDNI